MPAFKRIGLVGRQGHAGVVESLHKLVSVLRSLSVEVIGDENVARLLPGSQLQTVNHDDLGNSCDLVIVVGGDGSLLGVARSLSRHNVPVLGVNRGRLGFLTDIKPGELDVRIPSILAGNYTEETRFLLECDLLRDGKIIESGCALNDVVLHPGTAARMIEFELFVDDQFVYSQQSDGLIVATPTGSTAYSLSAGGPIMHPSLNAVVLVPMYPHSLSSRPLVIDGDRNIRVVLGPVRSIQPQVSCDGAKSFAANPGDTLIVRKQPQPLRLVHPLDHNYYETCRSKLGWGNRLVHPDE